MKYIIVSGTDWQEFYAEMQKLLDAGWRPQGGCSIATTRNAKEGWDEFGWDEFTVAQAMILPEENQP